MSHRKTRSRAEPMRTLRIICNDPDATDSSDDEGPAGAKKINRIIHQVCYPIRDPSKPPSKETKACPKSSPMPAAEPVKYRGVRKRYSGRWAAEIRHPIERRRVWLGTHTTPEEASRAYEQKRLEFEALARSVVVSKRVESSKQKKEVVVYGSDDSSRGGSAVSLPSMKAESGKGINVIKADVGESGALSEELEELARFGSEMDLDFGLDLLVVGGDDLGDPLGFGGGNFGIEEFPISDLESFDDLLGPLPDFNLDFDMDVYNEALAWIDDMAPPVDVAWP